MEGRDSRGHPLRGRNVMRGSAVGIRVKPPRRERTSRTHQPLKSLASRRGERQEGQRAMISKSWRRAGGGNLWRQETPGTDSA